MTRFYYQHIRPCGGWHLWSRLRRWCHLFGGFLWDVQLHRPHDFTQETRLSKNQELIYLKDALYCECGKTFHSQVIVNKDATNGISR